MKIELTPQQWNYIINLLAKQPYLEVFELIAEIQAKAKVDDVSVNE